MDELNRIIKSLRAWGSGQETPLIFYGICGNLKYLLKLPEATVSNLLEEAFLDWQGYSGSIMYPIPDPEEPSDPVAAERIYHSCSTYMDFWDDSPYGNLRRELCLHVADWLETNKSKVLPLLEEKFHD